MITSHLSRHHLYVVIINIILQKGHKFKCGKFDCCFFSFFFLGKNLINNNRGHYDFCGPPKKIERDNDFICQRRIF